MCKYANMQIKSSYHYCALNGPVAAGIKDLLRCSGLHFGAISVWVKMLLSITSGAWRGWAGLMVTDFSFESILLSATCWTFSSSDPSTEPTCFSKFVYSVPVCCVDPFLPRRPQHQTNHHVVDTVEQRLTDVSLLRKLNCLCPSVYTASIWLFQSNLMCNCTSRYLWLNTTLMVVIGVGWVLLQPHLKSKTSRFLTTL